jgi:hypothetical protein
MKAAFLLSGCITLMRVQGFSPVSISSRKIRPQYSFHERKPISSVHLFPTNMISATSSSIAKLSVIPQSISFLHQDYMFVLSSLLIMSTFGIFLERKTTIGKSLSVGSTLHYPVLYACKYNEISILFPILGSSSHHGFESNSCKSWNCAIQFTRL